MKKTKQERKKLAYKIVAIFLILAMLIGFIAPSISLLFS